MRPKTMFLFVIAAGCGLVASIGVSQYMEQASGEAAAHVETAKILVAVTDIAIGQKLDAQNVKLEEWPKDRVPEGAIAELKEVEERFARTRLYAGEPILKAKLMDSNYGSESTLIPKGYRVVSVKVSIHSAVAGLLQPGDRVDLLVFLRKTSEVLQTGTKTILRDVTVFAVDSETERSVDANGQARNVKTVSLLVKPSQAETVTLASELGLLYLTLRRPDDATEEVTEGETIQSLLGSEAEVANEDQNAKPSQPGGENFANWLTQQQATQPASEPQPAPVSRPSIAAPAWQMEVMSAGGIKKFVWHDSNQLPEEVTAGVSATTPAKPSPLPSAGAPADAAQDNSAGEVVPAAGRDGEVAGGGDPFEDGN